MYLILAQLPPPTHGAAVMNTKASAVIKELYPTSVSINTTSAESVADVGKASPRKAVKILVLFKTIIKQLYRKEIKYCYINLHPTGKVFYRDAAFCLLAKALNKKVTLHLHGRGISQSTSNFRKFIYKLTFKNTHVIHLSEFFFDEVSAFVASDRFIPVPNGTDDLGHLEKTQTTAKIQFYYLSNYMKGKGALELLNAAKHIYSPTINCRFIFAGDWFEADFKTEVMHWIDENPALIKAGYIQVLGPVHGSTKDKLIKNSDVFVFPSHIDTFPLVVLEAMSAGKMVISTSTGATPEILDYGEAGVLIPERDHLSLAKEISNVINNPEIINKYSIAARNRYLSTYTEEHFKNAFSAAIRKITSQQSQ